MNMISHAIAAVRECVEALGQNITPLYVQSVGVNSYRLGLKSTLWLRVGDVLTVGGTVTAVECGYIEVTNLTAPVTISTAPVYFMHGTVVNVSSEMNKINNATLFTPLVYYVEASSAELNFDRTRQIDSVNNARLLVLKSCNNNDWLTASHYESVIEVTEQIIEELIEKFRRSAKIGELTTGRIANYVNVGSQSEKSTVKNMFTYYFSGTEIKLDLPLRREICNC